MSENLKKVLHNKGIEITFFVEDGVARVEYKSGGDFDLSEGEDVVLFVNGNAVPVQSTSATEATAVIGPWAAFAGQPVQMMTRVGEFFDGWEFEP